jgi:hypothetical protein
MRNHFTDESWLDYVRGLSPVPKATAIQQHLEKGCTACHQSFQLWRTVTETAKSEVPHEVPEHLVVASQAAYVAWSRRHLLPSHARIALRILDSWLTPLPAGVRSDSPSPRRILERAGQWLVDLRFEPAAGKRMFLMGQVARSGKHHDPPVNWPILLMSPDTLLTETSANEFGEFQLQFDRANGLRIYIDVPRQRPIGILLPDLDTPSEARETAID